MTKNKFYLLLAGSFLFTTFSLVTLFPQNANAIEVVNESDCEYDRTHSYEFARLVRYPTKDVCYAYPGSRSGSVSAVKAVWSGGNYVSVQYINTTNNRLYQTTTCGKNEYASLPTGRFPKITRVTLSASKPGVCSRNTGFVTKRINESGQVIQSDSLDSLDSSDSLDSQDSTDSTDLDQL